MKHSVHIRRSRLNRAFTYASDASKPAMPALVFRDMAILREFFTR